ncbi:central kinetochore-associated-domain-containing protein [Myxozyma melibiosi]|uniref:Central kinetochore-associated-domain-containing protein n=1 Tax=Myxozyma melibiosi TaxID=54550 RepID=A0ABR1FCY8_9ASCO
MSGGLLQDVSPTKSQKATPLSTLQDGKLILDNDISRPKQRRPADRPASERVTVRKASEVFSSPTKSFRQHKRIAPLPAGESVFRDRSNITESSRFAAISPSVCRSSLTSLKSTRLVDSFINRATEVQRATPPPVANTINDDRNSLLSSPFEEHPKVHIRQPVSSPAAKVENFDEDQADKTMTPTTVKHVQPGLLQTPQTSYLLDLQTPLPGPRQRSSVPPNSEPTKEENSNTCLLDLDDTSALSPLSLPVISSREMKAMEDKYLSEINNLKSRLSEANRVVSDYKRDLDSAHGTIDTLEQRLKAENERLESVARELHIQYSRKHEQKITALKKQLEQKYASRLDSLEGELEELRVQLAKEREEKNDLVMYWDQYLEAEKNYQS